MAPGRHIRNRPGHCGHASGTHATRLEKTARRRIITPGLISQDKTTSTRVLQKWQWQAEWTLTLAWRHRPYLPDNKNPPAGGGEPPTGGMAKDDGTPGEIRTRDLKFRKLLLYPTELPVHDGVNGCLRVGQSSDWQMVIAATPTISSAEHPRDRSETGLASPWRIGP